MSNYFEQIEEEFSQIRGKYSPISPVDWQLAQKWLDKNIPLSVVLRAMDETSRNFEAQNRKGTINTLRYFEPEVEKQFAEYCKNSIGKFEENNMNNVIAYAVADETDTLDYLAAKLDGSKFPEPLRSVILQTKGEILALIDEATQSNISSDEIETRLAAIRLTLDTALTGGINADDRQLLEKEVQNDCGNYTPTAEILEKAILRKIYTRLDLPELTLFAL